MSLRTPTVLTPRRRRVALIAALAATCAAAGAPAIVIADDQPAPRIHTIGEPGPRYFDIEANKATSMRALGLHVAQPGTNGIPRYEDIEANKARSQRAH